MKILKITSRVVLLGVALNLAGYNSAFGQATNIVTPSNARRVRPTPPTRDPHTAGYVEAKELPDGDVPSPTVEGNFIIGSTHHPAPELAQGNELQGKVFNFTMSSADSKIYPGIARDAGTSGTPDPNDPAKLIVTTSHPAPYTRKVAVYVPKQYVPAPRRRSSWEQTARTRCCLRRWTI